MVEGLGICPMIYQDNDFLHHMTGERSMFQDLSQKGKIAKIDKISKHPFPSIDNVLFFEGLKHDLLSISQLCDNGYDVSFNKGECISNLHKINLTDLINQSVTCLVSINNDQWTWHKKLGHASLRLISKLKKHNLVRGLPSLVYKVDILCDACQKEKQVKGSFESKNIVSTSRPLETTSMSEQCYGLIVVDNYSRSTWVMFLNHKSDHGGEFENENFLKFCEEHDNLGKFDSKSYKGTFVGYSNVSKAYKVYNSRTLTIEESIHQLKNYHPEKQILGDVQDKVRTRSTFKNQAQVALLSKFETKSIDDAVLNEGYIKTMQEELDQL
ncbi:hypothetical protein CR513_24654, partial [Mucuna pruriens]